MERLRAPIAVAFEASGISSQAPLVSVIVPFYNVASYAERCLDSLVAQDFERYEVVCIDDGSTDGTGELLDRYEGAYPFVRVFHYEKSGLSIARNRGVALARAGLITFVDGDDYVSPHYVRTLYEIHRGRAGRMVRVGFEPSYSVEQAESGPWGLFEESDAMRPTRSIEGVSAVRRSFLLGEFPHYAWGTLAERGLYEHIPFEPGVLFEDIYASADLVPRLSEVVLVEAGLYGYTRRVGSICNPAEPDEQLLRDNLAAIRHFKGAVGEWGEELAAYAPVKVAWLYSGLCARTLVFGERVMWGTYLGEARRFVRENCGALLRAVRKGWLSPRVPCGPVAKAWLPQAWLAARGVRGWMADLLAEFCRWPHVPLSGIRSLARPQPSHPPGRDRWYKRDNALLSAWLRSQEGLT